MRILIIGAGIAGSTLAALLRQRGLDPVLIQKAHAWHKVGYVLGIWPLGSRVLHGLGLHDRYRETAQVMHAYNLADDRGKIVQTYEIPRDFRETYGDLYCIQRWELLEILREGYQLPVRLGTTVEHLNQTGRAVQVRFSDGSEDEFDRVVGCDGMRSEIRQLVFGDVPLHYTGQTGWAFWTDKSLAPDDQMTEYWASGRFFGIYPVRDALCVFCGTSAPANASDPVEGRIAKLRDLFGHLDGPAAHMLERLERPEDIFHDDFNDLKMDTWHRGRVLLIGDASAAFLPSAGIGASMAMESAAVLDDELSRADAQPLDSRHSPFSGPAAKAGPRPAGRLTPPLADCVPQQSGADSRPQHLDRSLRCRSILEDVSRPARRSYLRQPATGPDRRLAARAVAQ